MDFARVASLGRTRVAADSRQHVSVAFMGHELLGRPVRCRLAHQIEVNDDPGAREHSKLIPGSKHTPADDVICREARARAALESATLPCCLGR
jgi:hypothetical protein